MTAPHGLSFLQAIPQISIRREKTCECSGLVVPRLGPYQVQISNCGNGSITGCTVMFAALCD